MDAYVNQIVTSADHLADSGEPVNDTVVGGIILAGLPDCFKPLILGIQGSKQTTTTDFVKMLLIQENVQEIISGQTNSENVFQAKRQINYRRGQYKEPRCYRCNEIGHIAPNCPRSSHSKSFMAQYNFENQSKSDKRFIDSGATAHLTHKKP
jgi:hypothetical protein